MTNYPEKCHVRGCPCGYFSSKSPSEPSTTPSGDAGFLVPEAKNVSSSPLAQNSPISVNGHLLYSEQNCSVFHDSDKQCPVHKGGLTVCRLCGEYEAGLDQPCRKAVEPPEQATPDSPALRRGRSIGQPDVVTSCPDCGYCYYKNKPHTCADWTRGDESNALRNTKSILHHAELVEEQLYTESMRTRGVPHKPHEFIPQEYAREFCAHQPSPEAPRCNLSQMNVLAHTPPRERKHAQLTFEQEWQSAPKSIKHGCEETSAEFFYHAGRRDRETEMLREINEVLSGVVGRI